MQASALDRDWEHCFSRPLIRCGRLRANGGVEGTFVERAATERISSENCFHKLAVHVGEAEVAALKAMRQAQVVNPE